MVNKKPHKSLIGYYKKRSASFFKRLKETQSQLGVEDIHQLRVEIKRMRAILRLLEVISDHEFDKKEHLEVLLRLFKSAGRLREIQMNLSIVYLYPPSPFLTFKNKLLEAEELAFKEFQIVLEQFPTDNFKAINYKIEPLLAGIDQQKIWKECHAFVTDRLQQIDRLMVIFYEKESPHDIRIFLKAIAAILKLWNELIPDKKLKKAIKKITPVAELIGDWHDTFVLHKAMKKFARENDLFPHILDFQLKMKSLKRSSARMLHEIEEELEKILPIELPSPRLVKDKNQEILQNI